jgi:hypothetical protein
MVVKNRAKESSQGEVGSPSWRVVYSHGGLVLGVALGLFVLGGALGLLVGGLVVGAAGGLVGWFAFISVVFPI